jgi:hypothetical protein
MESRGGASSYDNCVPLCFDCHAEAGHYNSQHPKGTKYSSSELLRHRESWYRSVEQLSYLELEWAENKGGANTEVYEGQEVTLNGFVWRETFPGAPNYESFETDQIEKCWMLVLPEPIVFYVNCFETEATIVVENVKKLQLCVDSDFYKENQDIVRTNVELTGTLFMSITGHHHGDANFLLSK